MQSNKLCRKCNKPMGLWEYHPHICCFVFYQCTYGIKDYCIAFPNITETIAEYKIIYIFYQQIGRVKMQKMMHDKATYLESIYDAAKIMQQKIRKQTYNNILYKSEIFRELPRELFDIIVQKV